MDLSEFFLTKSELNDFLTKLQTIADTIYTVDFNLEKTLSTQFSVVKKDAFLKLMRENNVDNGSVASIKEFIQKIQTDISSLPIVALTIAFEPSNELMKAVSQWFITTINKQVLLDIAINPSLIAGAQVTYSGKFKDYSLRPLFTKMIDEMLETLERENQTLSLQKPIHQSTEHMEIGR